MQPEFTVNLLLWNSESNHRKMPWKGEKDPYRIWLSEIILQQTRVEQGLKYYERFIEAFPTIAELASAEENRVFKLWEGLGYYSRCRNLISTAKTIVSDYHGCFPGTYHEILKLKGIGPYTAAAISSFAFNEPRAVVDGNVQRVLSRYFGISTPINSISGKNLYQQLADAVLAKDQAAIFNQAIMDFGATICKPQNPLCQQCPQRTDCQAFQLDKVFLLPVKEKATEKRVRYFHYLIFQHHADVLVTKRTQKDIWQHLHEFVLLESSSALAIKSIEAFANRFTDSAKFSLVENKTKYKQILSHQIIHARFYYVLLEEKLDVNGGFEFIEASQLHQIAFPKIINTMIADGGLQNV